MSANDPGMPVRATVTGVVDEVSGDLLWARTDLGDFTLLNLADPAVQVVPIDPDRESAEEVALASVLDVSSVSLPSLKLFRSDSPDDVEDARDMVRRAIAALREAGYLS